jgi:uncharacterized cupredoxin-like copper-binding protein
MLSATQPAEPGPTRGFGNKLRIWDVQVSPKTTTAVVVQPTGPGRLAFYCSVHGHRAAGMVGTITVE